VGTQERAEDIDGESEASFTRAGSRQMRRQVRFTAFSNVIDHMRERIRRALSLAALDAPAQPSSRAWSPHFPSENSH
jgi:hypothetical protein